jgi:hypothetical protein
MVNNIKQIMRTLFVIFLCLGFISELRLIKNIMHSKFNFRATKGDPGVAGDPMFFPFIGAMVIQ